MTITIRFQGVMMLGRTGSESVRVVIPLSPDWRARLVVEAADTVEAEGFVRDESGAYVLADEVIGVSGLPVEPTKWESPEVGVPVLRLPEQATDTERRPRFLQRVGDYILGLSRRIFRRPKSLSDQARARQAPSLAATHLELTGGVIFQERANGGDAIARPSASGFVYRAMTDGNVIFRASADRWLRVSNDATLSIQNEPVTLVDDGPNDNDSGHFDLYYRFGTSARRRS